MNSGSLCQRPGCGREIPPSRGQTARWCTRKCEGRAYRAAKLRGIPLADYPPSGELLPVGSTDTLSEAYERIQKRDDPRAYDDFGDAPGDVELAAEMDEDAGTYAGTFISAHPDDIRINAMLRAEEGTARARTPRDTWRHWRAYGKRHGTEHPAQTQDRLRRHQADQAARTRRIDAKTASAPQDRFDTRTSGYVATRATESRRMNARYVDRPPRHEPQEFELRGRADHGHLLPAGTRSGRASQVLGLRLGHPRRLVTTQASRACCHLHIRGRVPLRDRGAGRFVSRLSS